MTPQDFISAARVPKSIQPQKRGWWTIERKRADSLRLTECPADEGTAFVGFDDYTLLRRISWNTLHLEGAGEIVMEDSARELRKHLPIWMGSYGRVLKTGLGLGCVVRGLLANPLVEHVTCIEIDPDVIEMIGPEFSTNPRVEIICADALIWEPRSGDKWDFAWHDIWTDGEESLQLLHMRLAMRFHRLVGAQGAWAFPRVAKNLIRRKWSNPERWLG